jgi:zinc/manganese transport system substrate-binding protein
MAAVTLAASACAIAPARPAGARIYIVAAENQYGDVGAQIGGQYVSVSSIESNPDTDPHTYEVSASVAQEVAGANVVIQNGLGYDTFMDDVENAAPSSGRKIIDVQRLLGLPASTPNPHLWYSPTTMPAVARALAADLSAMAPAHAAYFQANAARFIASLQPWLKALSGFATAHPGTPVATTEPVADYLLVAAGTVDETPFRFQADIMNGVDPAPQDVTRETDLLARRQVKVFVYNQQVTDSLTDGFIAVARKAGVPVVGVYETMPTPGYDYQSWMLAEVRALERAVTTGASTSQL